MIEVFVDGLRLVSLRCLFIAYMTVIAQRRTSGRVFFGFDVTVHHVETT